MYDCNSALLEQKKSCSVSVSAKCLSCSSFVDHRETKSDFEGPIASTAAGYCCGASGQLLVASLLLDRCRIYCFVFPPATYYNNGEIKPR